MQKPNRKEDLIPQFGAIGEPGWDKVVNKILVDYEVPLPAPIQEEEIAKREQKLEIKLDNEWRLFLKTFGAVNFDGLPKLFELGEIANPERIWLRECLSEAQLGRVKSMFGVGGLLGDTDLFGLELATGHIYILVHDGCRISFFLNTFSDLIKYGLINLCTGYYGWPGDEIEKLADDAMKATFGEDF